MDTIIDSIKLDESNIEFNYASEFVKYTDKLIYLTGKAGTGKTTFLKYLRATTNKNTVILAPTGVAAVNAGGQTIHSFFQIKPSVYVPNDKRLRTSNEASKSDDKDKSTIYEHFKYFKEKLDIINGLELLIIDEISMVRCDLLDVIDRLLRVFRKRPNEPFGGVQVILIGDTFQLAPIAKPDEWEILSKFYQTEFFFGSKVIQANTPVYIELKKIYRQNEQDFIDLLNKVRINQVSQSDLNFLNSKYNPTFSPNKNDNYITLATHNKIVDSTNLTKLSELTTELKIFNATITGTFPDNIMPTDEPLQLKEGSQIMFIKNDKTKRYYSGKIAKLNKIEDKQITVEFSDGTKISVEKQVWENVKYSWNESEKKIEEQVIGTFTQFPIKLAWAITVHKSQGLTFEKVIADLGASFASGQVYVALSRCTTFSGLVLKTKVDNTAIKTDKQVIKFAQNETPNTLIIQELNSGKADAFYRKLRETIKVANFAEAYNIFIKALKFRNDIETDIFRRYFVAYATRLALYKTNYNELEDINKDINVQKDEIKSELYALISKSNEQEEKIEEQNNSIKLLLGRIKQLENQNESAKSEITDISLKLDKQIKITEENESTIRQQKKTILSQIADFEGLTKINKRNIEEQKSEILNLNTEIERLKKLKWYQKLMGQK